MVQNHKKTFIPAVKTHHIFTLPTEKRTLFFTIFPTPLGSMYALADQTSLYILQFYDHPKLQSLILKCLHLFKAKLEEGITTPLETIQEELKAYFEGSLKTFKTPIHIWGTHFQKISWLMLQQIPYGQTKSYAQQARELNKPSAHRAIAGVNSANRWIIIVPCHRIIRNNGSLGGYNANIDRKIWLLEHEKKSHAFKKH